MEYVTAESWQVVEAVWYWVSSELGDEAVVPDGVEGLREVEWDDVDIVMLLKHVGLFLEQIDEYGSGRAGGPEPKLVWKVLTVVGMFKYRVE